MKEEKNKKFEEKRNDSEKEKSEKELIGEIKEKLERCQKLSDEYLNGWKKERADFLNYKKNETERVEELIKYANEEFILKLLPVLDTFYLSEKELPEKLKNNQWVDGFLKIKNQVLNFLKNQGVEEIKSQGEEFDPNFHEAVEMEKNNGGKSGIVVEEVKKGYLLSGKVLRPAQVKVTK